MDEFDCDDIIHIYHTDRWDIETGYNIIKKQLDIEQVNSANPITILNELMSKIIYFNIELLTRHTSETRRKKDFGHIVNNKHVVELCHSSWFVRCFFACRFIKKL